MPDGALPEASTCPPGKVLSGADCVEERIFVRPDGDDLNPGTAARPLKSFRAAMRTARANQAVVFEPGTWSMESTGDNFNEHIPGRVNVAKLPGEGLVVFDGGDTATLQLEDEAFLDGVTLRRFYRPFAVSSGHVMLHGISIEPARSWAHLTGTANVQCSRCVFRGGPVTSEPVIVVEDAASFELTQSSIEEWERSMPGIAMLDSASLVMKAVIISGGITPAISASGAVSVKLRNVDFHTVGLYDVQVGGSVTDSPKLFDVSGTHFSRGISLQGSVEAVRFRNSELLYLALYGDGREYDLGRVGDAGGNVFHEIMSFPRVPPVTFQGVHLQVVGSGTVVHAHGNTWRANKQGADAEGHYLEPRTMTSADYGENISVIDNGLPDASVQTQVQL